MVHIIDFFSEPFWYRLGLTLVHFLWQGLIVAVVIGTIVGLFRLRRGNIRYAAYLFAFIVMIGCPIVTFTVLDVPARIDITPVKMVQAAPVVPVNRTDSDLYITETEHLGLSQLDPYPTQSEPDVFVETDTFVPETTQTTFAANSVPLHERVYDYILMAIPSAVAGWTIGVLILSLRMLLGFAGVYRWRRHLQPLPDDLCDRVGSLCRRLGMKHFSRVFISPSAIQAMAVGYLRPMILLPSALVMRMQPEMLEAVIAHELAHIRRFDLWVNLLQRVIEILLFFHPAVWWLSNCLRNERELCCDETAVKITGEPLTYASALESAGLAILAIRQPELALGFGQSKKPTLARIRHVLGLTSAQSNLRVWVAGIVTTTLLCALVISMAFVLAARGEAADDASEVQWLQYHTSAGPVQAVQMHGNYVEKALKVEFDRPRGVDLPDFKGDKPLFTYWPTPMVKSGRLWIALYRSQNGRIYDRLLIDSNGDGHLKDETPLVADKIVEIYAYFGPVKVTFETQDGPIAYHLNLHLHDREQILYISSGGWYEGPIAVGQNKAHCVLIDNNVNGTFDDKSIDPNERDWIYIGAKGDPDKSYVGDYIDVGGELYELKVARDGAYVKFNRATDVSLGKVRLPESIAEFSAAGENGLFRGRPNSGICELPAGKYHIEKWVIERTDKEGVSWELRGGTSSPHGLFSVVEDRETKLEIGEPLVASFQVQSNEAIRRLRLTLKSRLGESVRLIRDGVRAPYPRLTVRNKDNTYNRTYAFRYG